MIEIRSPHLTGAEVSWFAPLVAMVWLLKHTEEVR